MDTNPTTPSSQAQSPRSPYYRPQAEGAPSAEESLGVALDQAVRSVGTLYRQAHVALQEQVERAPYVTLGVAAGLGFIVGGGLASPLGQVLVRQSVRAFGPPLLQSILNAAAAGFDQPGQPAAQRSESNPYRGE